MESGDAKFAIMNGSSHRFSVLDIADPEKNPFDRQQRIEWWDQKRLQNAHVLVIGAGAIGNETLKNLALLGVGNIYIVDFDEVSTSNLSRTVLFRRGDEGKRKAELAALRTSELCLFENARVHWFHGDVVWDVGTGIFRSMDIILGCLDNVESRFAINRQCWLAGRPWIDSGIRELGGHIAVYTPPSPPCYECIATEQQRLAARRRYSCDDFKLASFNEGKVPTVQVTSSLISAFQVQEAVKVLCGQAVQVGHKLYFQGKFNDFDLMRLPINDSCNGHVSYPRVKKTYLTHAATLFDFLKWVSNDEHSGSGAKLDFRSDRTFVVSSMCKCGTRRLTLNRPSFRIMDTDILCKDCDDLQRQKNASPPNLPVSKEIAVEFDIEQPSHPGLLAFTLDELGIPDQHILAVRNRNGNYQYYELAPTGRMFKTVCSSLSKDTDSSDLNLR